MLIFEDGEANSTYSSRSEQVSSYRESFKEELVHFHECVTSGRTPVTSGLDSLHDIALCAALVDVHRSRTRMDHPSEPATAATRHHQ